MKLDPTLTQKLDQFSFHDMVLNQLSIDFDYSFFRITFESHREQTNTVEKWQLSFKDLISFDAESLPLNKDSDVEITQFDYTYTDCFKGKLMLSLGFGQPSFTLVFTCRELHLMKE